MFQRARRKWLWFSIMVPAFLCGGILLAGRWSGYVDAASQPHVISNNSESPGKYVVLAWNDLGMHCYNRDFTDLAVLPPFNNLWAQVIRVADPPEVVTKGLEVEFFFADNTYSVNKSNFWDTSPYRPVQNAEWLFNWIPGFVGPLPANVGLAGMGLSGTMKAHSDHFTAEGIPLTEFSDSLPNTPDPYQLATVVVRDAATGMELARTQPVAPVSTEMHCDYCHSDHGIGNDEIATGKVETNILTKHDRENMEGYPSQYSGPLMDRRPVLCAWCHSTNALGAPGAPGIPNLSKAMHGKHAEEGLPSTLTTCYSCHPGPRTQCLRDVMSTQFGLDCINCHGSLQNVSQNPSPWLQEPRCDNEACHGSAFGQDQALYRMSKEHGGVYCEGCHDSTHAVAPSRVSKDAIKFIGWQGHSGVLDTCTVCHASWPTQPGPHNLPTKIVRSFSLEPNGFAAREPGAQAIYTHSLHNNGNVSDTYQLIWSSSQNWASVSPSGPTLQLSNGQTGLITVTVTIPGGEAVRGLVDRTVVTVTSTTSPTLVATVTDVTLVPRSQIFLPFLDQH